MTKLLGLDISSSCIGYSVLSIDETKQIKFVSVDYLKPIKDGDIIERLADTRDKIKSIIEQIKPDSIVIENIIMFISGMSTAKTIVTLASFNRMICLLAFDYLHRMPNMYGVMAIRHGIKAGTELPAKEDMPELVAWHLGIDFPWEYGKKGKIKMESYDKSDAIAVGLMHAFSLGGKTNPKNLSPILLPKKSKTKNSSKK